MTTKSKGHTLQNAENAEEGWLSSAQFCSRFENIDKDGDKAEDKDKDDDEGPHICNTPAHAEDGWLSSA